MGLIVRPHSYADGVPARPDHANANEITVYAVINGNLNWDNITAALINAANGFLKLDASGLVPLAQIPVLTAVKLTAAIPSGVIVMWSGLLSAIPSGWSLCTGAGSTPDLRDKFIRGAAAAANPGATGGSDTITLAIGNLPSHTHAAGTLAAASAGAHQHTARYLKSSANGTADYNAATVGTSVNTGFTTPSTVPIGSAGAHPHTLTGSTASTGSGTAFDNRPAYYALAFIMKD